MNEEEKQAIEILNSQLLKTDGYDRHQKAIDIILNLIEKQQKEIEELKSEFAINTEIHKKDLKIKELKEINECLHQTDKELFVSKDKIKEKIKELENHIWKDGYMTKFDRYAIHYLKELLGE